MGRDFARLLQQGLSIGQLELIDRVAREAVVRGMPLYAVGGLPRDLVVGALITDLDLVVEGDAVALAEGLAAKYGGKVTSHHRFGTAKWELRNRRPAGECAGLASESIPSLDLISARGESYGHPAALPRVRPGSIEADLSRRDFTINTLAIRLDGAYFGEVRDDHGALEDIERGIVRVLHPASFRDDPTRMYRAVRYEQRFGFKIAADTLALLPGGRELIGGLSAQRIRNELDLILDESPASSMLRRLEKLELLAVIEAAMPQDDASTRRVRLAATTPEFSLTAWSRRSGAWILWLMGLSDRKIASVADRLQLRADLRRSIVAAAELARRLGTMTGWQTGKIVARLDQMPPAAIYAVYRASPRGSGRTLLRRYLSRWRYVRPSTTGDDLKRRGLAPGPLYRAILQKLRDARLAGQVTSEREELRLLEALIAGRRGAGKASTSRSRSH